MLQDLQIFYALMHRHLLIGTLLLLAYWLVLVRVRLAKVVALFLSLVFLLSIPGLYVPYLLSLAALTGLWKLGGFRTWKFIPAAAAVMLLLQIRVAAPYVRRFHELEALRAANPPISLVARLGDETRHADAPGGMVIPATAQAGSHRPPDRVEQELERAESRLEHFKEGEFGDYERRRSLAGLSYIEKLENLHEHVAFEFVQAEGLGVSRMRAADLNQPAFEIPDLPSLTLPDEPEMRDIASPEAGPGQGLAQAEGEQAPGPDLDLLLNAHEASAFNFVNRNGFGFVASPERVFGFQPHGFRTQPRLPDSDDRPSPWRITTLQLVSLLKHETAVVYLSDSLPRMDKLVDVSTRAVDDFEVGALAKLRAGEQIVVEPGREEIRMLGSLRAAKQCRQCHSVERGDLLGAFTYRLRRSSAGPVVKKPLL